MKYRKKKKERRSLVTWFLFFFSLKKSLNINFIKPGGAYHEQCIHVVLSTFCVKSHICTHRVHTSDEYVASQWTWQYVYSFLFLVLLQLTLVVVIVCRLIEETTRFFLVLPHKYTLLFSCCRAAWFPSCLKWKLDGKQEKRMAFPRISFLLWFV